MLIALSWVHRWGIMGTIWCCYNIVVYERMQLMCDESNGPLYAVLGWRCWPRGASRCCYWSNLKGPLAAHILVFMMTVATTAYNRSPAYMSTSGLTVIKRLNGCPMLHRWLGVGQHPGRDHTRSLMWDWLHVNWHNCHEIKSLLPPNDQQEN